MTYWVWQLRLEQLPPHQSRVHPDVPPPPTRCETFHPYPAPQRQKQPGTRCADMMDVLLLHPGLWRGDIFGCWEGLDSSVLSVMVLTSAIWLQNGPGFQKNFLIFPGWPQSSHLGPYCLGVPPSVSSGWTCKVFEVWTLAPNTWENFDLG